MTNNYYLSQISFAFDDKNGKRNYARDQYRLVLAESKEDAYNKVKAYYDEKSKVMELMCFIEVFETLT